MSMVMRNFRNHEVEELEGDIKAKDDVLMKEHFRYNRILRNADRSVVASAVFSL